MQILATDVEKTFTDFPIPACSSNFLTVRFKTGRDIEVDDVADIVLVDAHTERNLDWSAMGDNVR